MLFFGRRKPRASRLRGLPPWYGDHSARVAALAGFLLPLARLFATLAGLLLPLTGLFPALVAPLAGLLPALFAVLAHVPAVALGVGAGAHPGRARVGPDLRVTPGVLGGRMAVARRGLRVPARFHAGALAAAQGVLAGAVRLRTVGFGVAAGLRAGALAVAQSVLSGAVRLRPGGFGVAADVRVCVLPPAVLPGVPARRAGLCPGTLGVPAGVFGVLARLGAGSLFGGGGGRGHLGGQRGGRGGERQPQHPTSLHG
jgi:hypothetical protein